MAEIKPIEALVAHIPTAQTITPGIFITVFIDAKQNGDTFLHLKLCNWTINYLRPYRLLSVSLTCFGKTQAVNNAVVSSAEPNTTKGK